MADPRDDARTSTDDALGATGHERGALGGVRVIDLTQVMSGPYATMMLADFGADVIKVEPPAGDQARRSAGAFRAGDDTAGFLALNRNKRSIAIDLKSEAGLEVFLDLVATADVVVENFRPGVTVRLGIDHETLLGRHPHLVYASISGFGQDGPYARRPGFDLITQGMAGLMSVTGEPGRPPVKCGIPVSDLAAGMLCANAILVAYVERLRSGHGQYLETSLYDAVLAMSVWESTQWWSTGEVPEPMGSAHRMNAPYQALRTGDGWMTVAANNDRLWRRLCVALDRVDLLDDDRFSTNVDRLRHVDVLAEELETTLALRPTDEWVDLLLEAGTPAGPIRNYRQVLDDPHTHARGMVQQVQHPVEGPIETLGVPVKLDRTPGRIRTAAPLLGEHTADVLAELGRDADAVDALLEAGVVNG